MAKKKKKGCAICRKPDHITDECPYISEECCMGDDCKKFCMVHMCTKLHRIIKKFYTASSYEKVKRVFEKLEDFEDVLESAYEYHECHMGCRCRSCSSKKRVKMLIKSCTKLREKYEDKFESDDDDDDWLVHCCMPVIEVKEIIEGKSQASQQNPRKTPGQT